MPHKMEEIAQALRESAAVLNWTPTQIAAPLGRSERAARTWMDASAAINGPDLLELMRTMPGFAERLGLSLPPKSEAVRGAA